MSSWTAATGIPVPRLWLRSSVLVISGEHAGRCQAGHMTGSGGLRAWERASWASTDQSCSHRRPQMTHLTPLRFTPLPNFSARSFHHEGTWTSVTRRLSPASHCHQCPPARSPACWGTLRCRGGSTIRSSSKLRCTISLGCLTHSGRGGPTFIPLGFPLSFHFWGWDLGGKQRNLDGQVSRVKKNPSLFFPAVGEASCGFQMPHTLEAVLPITQALLCTPLHSEAISEEMGPSQCPGPEAPKDTAAG